MFMKMAVFWLFALCTLVEAASISETSVNFYQTTRRKNPEDSQLILAAVRTSDLTKQCLFPS
jgi:hypothetical protein